MEMELCAEIIHWSLRNRWIKVFLDRLITYCSFVQEASNQIKIIPYSRLGYRGRCRQQFLEAIEVIKQYLASLQKQDEGSFV